MTRNNNASMVRPDNIDVLIQQDFALTSQNWKGYMKTEPKTFDWTIETQDEDEDTWLERKDAIDDVNLDITFDPAMSNVMIPFDSSSGTEVKIASNVCGILESYQEKSIRDQRNNAMSLEDGRSRRYLVRSGPALGAVVSHKLTMSGEVIRFGYISDSKGFVTNRTSLIRWSRINGKPKMIGITILHGQNMSWYIYNRKTRADIKDMVNSIKFFFKYANRVLSEMKNWASENDAYYIVILCKDHRLRYPHFNYMECWEQNKITWNLPSPVAALNDCWNDPQWWETHGYNCSREIQGDICLSHVDDHCPALFTFRWDGHSYMPSEIRKKAQRFFLRNKGLPLASMRGYGENERHEIILDD